jgi:hypothetical protein
LEGTGKPPGSESGEEYEQGRHLRAPNALDKKTLKAIQLHDLFVGESYARFEDFVQFVHALDEGRDEFFRAHGTRRTARTNMTASAIGERGCVAIRWGK